MKLQLHEAQALPTHHVIRPVPVLKSPATTGWAPALSVTIGNAAMI
jgi:hypothetical protein